MWKRALVYWSRAAAQARIFRIFFCHFYYLIFYLSLLFIRFYYYYLSSSSIIIYLISNIFIYLVSVIIFIEFLSFLFIWFFKIFKYKWLYHRIRINFIVNLFRIWIYYWKTTNISCQRNKNDFNLSCQFLFWISKRWILQPSLPLGCRFNTKFLSSDLEIINHHNIYAPN